MSISLFRHNQEAYESACAMLRDSKRAAIIHPTGTGKSFIGFKLCEDHPDQTICWLSPSAYIYRNQIENLKRAADGYVPQNIRFLTYAKLMQMPEDEIASIRPDCIILDEFHRCGAQMWGRGVQTLLENNPEIPVLGLSATAIRYLDNQRDMAEELFDGQIASEMTLGEALVRGILNPPTYIQTVYSYRQDYERLKRRVHSAKNRTVRTRAEEYLEALRRALDKADGLDIIFDRHMKERSGKYIVFCANLDHMHEMMDKVPEWFRLIDREPHVYSVYADDPSVSEDFRAFCEDDSDHLRLLFCIDMLNEGVHIEDISGVILFRPTVSPIIYKQQIGRALSAAKTKEPVIFDIVNNIESLYSIGSVEHEMFAAANYYRFHGHPDEIVREHFRVIDEVKDVRTLFDQLNDTLTASWDIMYDHASAYYASHGNLLVPKRYKTEDGCSLGSWISTQRRVYHGEQYGTLDETRIRRLDEIGMIWENIRDISWQRYYAEASTYYEQHGHLNIPADYCTDSGIRLGLWISRLRTYRRNGTNNTYLSSENIRSLDTIGMIWDLPDHQWEENYLACCRYYEEHGNLQIPSSYISPDGHRIGAWIRRQRDLRKGKVPGAQLLPDQIARLDRIGMQWSSTRERAWETGYAEAKAYYDKNGNLEVPVTYTTPSGFALGTWIRDRRERGRSKLSAAQVQQLDAIDMRWDPTNPWEERFALAMAYYGEHGNLNVPAQYKPNGIWLAKWLSEQRQIYTGNRPGKQLSADQIHRLESIGMDWMTSAERTWESYYDSAERYYAHHGNLDVASGFVSEDGRAIGRWLWRIRKGEIKLQSSGANGNQIERLKKIGFTI